MATADELRAEARHWRELWAQTLDDRVRALLEEMASELEARAEVMEAGQEQEKRPEEAI